MVRSIDFGTWRVHHCFELPAHHELCSTASSDITRTVMTFDGRHHRSGLDGPGTTKPETKPIAYRNVTKTRRTRPRCTGTQRVVPRCSRERRWEKGSNPRPHRDHARIRPRVPLGRLLAIANPAEPSESLLDTGKLPKRWAANAQTRNSPTGHAVWQSPRTRLDGNDRILLMRCDHPSQDQID